MPRQKDPERIYYEELFEMLDIPFIRRETLNSRGINMGITYFINPITGRQNDVSLQNLRRVVEQMISTGAMMEEIKYNPIDTSSSSDLEESDNEVIENIRSYDEVLDPIESHFEEIESRNSYDNPTFSTVRNALIGNKGSMVRIVLYKNEAIILDKTYRVPRVGFGGFWHELSSFDLMIDSDTPVIPTGNYSGEYLNSNYSMEVFIISEVTGGSQIIQNFQEGITHCILYPIKNWADECHKKAISYKSKQRYNAKLQKIEKLLVKYNDGVPENEIHAICELLQIDIKVDLPFNINEPFIYCKSTKKRLKLFEFINTRLHHVDLNEVVLNEHTKPLNRDELYVLKEKLDEKLEYYIYKKDTRGISCITSFSGKYTINSKYHDVVTDFEEKNNFNMYKIDDISDYKLSKFIKCGTHYNATVDFKDIYPYTCKKKSLVKHIDMEKAYVNFHKCKWYEGFMGKITDYRKTDRIVNTGLYLVSKFIFPKRETSRILLASSVGKSDIKNYNDIMKIYSNNNVYSSPELKMLSSLGVKFEIISGCWGVKTFDFKFNDDMINSKDDDNIKFYARWTGSCDQHELEQSFYMKGDYDLFQNIRNYVSEGTVRWVGVGEGCINYKKSHNYHLGHITAQITMYQRLNVIEQLLKMDINKIIRVCVDGIYYEDHKFKLQNVFRTKEDVKFGNEAGDRYITNIYNEIDDVNVYDITGNEFADERDHFEKELHLGAGGTGKTHKALVDNGLIKVLYVAPSRKLVRKKNADYAITSDVLSNLIMNDVEKYGKIARYFNVLIFDEVSMYTETSKQKIFERFDMHKLIFCGDIGYQLPTFEGKPITIVGFDKVFNHTINYRIECKELQKLCDLLRDYISKGIKKNCIDSYKYSNLINNVVENFFIKRNRMIDIEELKEIYDIKDYILVGTKKVGSEYTKMFTGAFLCQSGDEKYYINSNTDEFSNGDVIIESKKPNGCNAEIRHHFTTHSIQGETITSRIFIDCSKMFDSRMFYTAISRAKYLNQIYIVKKCNLS